MLKFIFFLLFLGITQVMAQESLTQAQASNLAKLPLKCVQKEYPNKLDHVMNDGGEVQNPKRLHPAFY